MQSPELHEVVVPPGNVVTLRQDGQFLNLSPQVRGLEEYLYTVCQVRDHDRQKRASIVPLREKLVWADTFLEKPVTRCPAGLKPLITELLQRLGFKVRHTGEPLAVLPEPALEELADFKVVDDALLDFVHKNERGLILYDRRGKVSVARLIAQIILAWPKKRIVIVATRVKDARRLRRHLLKYVKRVGLLTGRNLTPYDKQVIVSTPGSLAGEGVSLPRRHIYIALNPDELFGGQLKLGLQGISRLWKARLYGLLPVDARLAPRRRDLVASLFGVEEIIIPRHGHRPLPVEVVFSPIRGGQRPPDHRDESLIKRLGVDEHDVRNRRIKQLAGAVAANDVAGLKEKFPEVAAELVNHKKKRPRVGVLVDDIKHGLTLARLLNWPLVVSPHFFEEGLTDAEKDFIERGRDEKVRVSQPVVVTGCGLKRAGKFDVLIRADGGVGMPAIPHPMLCVPQGKKRRLLLIDFRDEHHPKLRRWSRQRRFAYMEMSWQVAGEKVLTPLEKFMAARPEVV